MIANTTMRSTVAILLLAWLVTPMPGRADPIDGASPDQLRQWLTEYPKADANRDGVLTVDEARTDCRKLQRDRPAEHASRPRMREIRQSGSEGGEAELNRPSLPLSQRGAPSIPLPSSTRRA